ncbi:MAG TPA: YezD family protein [Candidatus Sulfotelmatobacter sp.]|nr:YezD family protein [Candidatus Sulfotelmatobacter sp.]
MSAPPKTEDNHDKLPVWLDIVRRQVGSLHFGVVQIVVHDSEVTQIDKTERVRLQKSQS